MQVAMDVEALRAQTPGCAIGAHFNHSGASLPTRATLAAVVDHLEREALYGAMEAATGAAEGVAAARADAAALLGAKPDEIAFTSSGSAAFGLVFAALPKLARGERILVGRQEWGGNLATMRAAADRAGASVEAIPVRQDGSADPEALARLIDDRVRLISLTWLPANGGLINDAVAIGRIARAVGVPYFVDAGQAVGQIPIDVETIGCDMLKGAGRKYLRGPRGTALLYVRRTLLERLEPPFLDVQSGPWSEHGPVRRQDARLFETIEGSVALLLGLGAALKQARSIGIEPIGARIGSLAESLRGGLRAIPGVTVRDLGAVQSGLVSFTVDGLGAQDVRTRLAQDRITVGANGVPYTPLDMTARNLREIVRASVSYINTEAEIDRLVSTVAAIAKNTDGPLRSVDRPRAAGAT
ncbi:aminotransferase class V-fold PLP-dependent enzyme [Dongia deserti]|uniref:aminotransferase class V-fold PLP-dependent enzyme n=1 Tax=Dongia deserti TaxID=2268030 RepID=UPI000E64F977|nr:aminotransferase class V-fold PLP-dependent enzyme [Dongia deserti]